MTAYTLLKPRYRVIADYPDNHIKVGFILTAPVFTYDIDLLSWCKNLDRYPHLFKKLEWWEERDEKDMPKRISHKGVDGLIEIVRWEKHKVGNPVGITLTANGVELACQINENYYPVD